MKALVAAAIFSILGLSHVVVGGDNVDPNKEYCEMVNTYKESNGEFGWPDFEGKFNKVCLTEE